MERTLPRWGGSEFDGGCYRGRERGREGGVDGVVFVDGGAAEAASGAQGSVLAGIWIPRDGVVVEEAKEREEGGEGGRGGRVFGADGSVWRGEGGRAAMGRRAGVGNGLGGVEGGYV